MVESFVYKITPEAGKPPPTVRSLAVPVIDLRSRMRSILGSIQDGRRFLTLEKNTRKVSCPLFYSRSITVEGINGIICNSRNI